MQYRPFGKQNFRCSEIGFGAWAIGGAWGAQADSDSLAALHRALDLGVNFIDTAAGYGNGRSERLIGQVLRERAAVGKKRKCVCRHQDPARARHLAALPLLSRGSTLRGGLSPREYRHPPRHARHRSPRFASAAHLDPRLESQSHPFQNSSPTTTRRPDRPDRYIHAGI